MGGASAPLWVTIMLGVLAVIGTVGGAWGGQVIAARRDDRRWEREQAREDLRWRRDQHLRAVQLDHDARMQWREQRLQAFTEMVSAAAAWTNLVALHRHSILKEGLSVDRFNLLHDAFKAVGHAWSSVELVGSEKVLARARSLFKIVQEEFFAVLQEDLDLLDQRDRKSVLSGIEELKAVFRHDLGVRCSDTEPVSRERPFETTS